MNSWFIRHTNRMGVLDEDVDRLWNEDRIAIHFPGTGPADSESLDPRDYLPKAALAIRRFVGCAEEGGYVWAQYRTHKEAKVGLIAPGTKIEIINATWRSSFGSRAGTTAKLKSLRLARARAIAAGDWMALRAGRPRQGTFSVWRKAFGKLEALLENRELEHDWSNLSTAQHEIVCSEFLRCHQRVELPKLKWLLLPPGRTLKDIDIYGIATDGKLLLAQITFLKKCDTEEKKNNLQNYISPSSHSVMFCRCQKASMGDGICFVPVEEVFRWLEDNREYAALCFSGESCRNWAVQKRS